MKDGLENIYYEKNIYKTITKESKQVMEILGDRLIKVEKNTKSIEDIITEMMED